MNELEDVKEAFKRLDQYKKMHNSIVEDLDKRLHTTLVNYQTSAFNFHSAIYDVYNKSDDVHKKLFEEHFDDLEVAYTLFNETAELWPEIFVKEEPNDTKDSQIQ